MPGSKAVRANVSVSGELFDVLDGSVIAQIGRRPPRSDTDSQTVI